jgi:uncharacterized protein
MTAEADSDLPSFALTAAAAFVGAAVFHFLKLPAPSLSGAMVGVVLLLAAGRKAMMPTVIANGAMLLTGVAMGAAVTPEMLGGFQKYPLSIAIFALCIAATIYLTQLFLRRAGGWDRLTAFLAATPGALSTVLAVAAETKADMLRLSIVQSLRLFTLVAILPSLVIATGGSAPFSPKPDATLAGLAAMCASGLAIAIGLSRVGMAAPWIFGGLLGSAVLHGSGLVVGDAPQFFTETAFGLVGLYIGCRFSAITWAALKQALAMSIGALLIGLAVCAASAWLLHALTGLPYGMILVAFAPGGLEAMLVLGASLGLDPIYVGLHHLVRFFGIAFLLPVALPLIQRLDARSASSRDGT